MFATQCVAGKRTDLQKESTMVNSNDSNHRKSVTVIGVAVVLQGDRVLVGVRDTKAHLPGMHEFPGGKCEPEESAAACAIRECAEETGIMVEAVELLDRKLHSYGDQSLDLSFLLCRPVERVAENDDLSGFQWFKIRELNDLKFPEANFEVVKLLVDRFSTDSGLA